MKNEFICLNGSSRVINKANRVLLYVALQRALTLIVTLKCLGEDFADICSNCGEGEEHLAGQYRADVETDAWGGWCGCEGARSGTSLPN